MTDIPANDRETLWVTDAELIRRSGVPSRVARLTIKAYDKNPASGFHRKDPNWGDRRYWPAVVAFFEANTDGYPRLIGVCDQQRYLTVTPKCGQGLVPSVIHFSNLCRLVRSAPARTPFSF